MPNISANETSKRDKLIKELELAIANGIEQKDKKNTYKYQSGWALRSRPKYSKKRTGKHISKKVWNFLEGYFLEGDMDKSKRFTATSMLECLKSKVEEEVLDENEILKLQTIQGWIARYSAQHRQKMAESQ
ncbi:34251_t:CDS:2 [Gigaspora margarita]|uniref:34251_t:CDS:1 n=1 Tax=Gigaspora margarita TaxID=4874 RepID=A0ABN7V145_GIGMA|nr:34251_t:CDS:2 [Gigaspora margarita]